MSRDFRPLFFGAPFSRFSSFFSSWTSLHDGEAGVEPTTEHSDEQFQHTVLIHGLFLVILSFCPFQWGGVCLGKRTNLVVTSECRRVIAVSLRHETAGQFFAFLSGNEVFRPSGLSWKCVPRLPRRSLAAHFFCEHGGIGGFLRERGWKGGMIGGGRWEPT